MLLNYKHKTERKSELACVMDEVILDIYTWVCIGLLTREIILEGTATKLMEVVVAGYPSIISGLYWGIVNYGT